jgi:hypothetical protein
VLRFVVALIPLLAVLAATACQDPCVTLAEHICDCELTTGQRQACRTDRISNQQSSVTTTDADRQFCSEKLDTCTCDALDNNDLDACGFVPESTSK